MTIDECRRWKQERDEARAEVERLHGIVDMADELRFAIVDEADELRAQRDEAQAFQEERRIVNQRLHEALERTRFQRDEARAERDTLRRVLEQARYVLAHTDEESLGRHPETGHPYRDEYVHFITRALASVGGDK